MGKKRWQDSGNCDSQNLRGRVRERRLWKKRTDGQTSEAGWPTRGELVGRGKGQAEEVDETVLALKPRKEQEAS